MIFTTIADARKQTGLSYLGTRNISVKLIKNEKVSNVITYCMYLAPANTSGYNVCPGSTKECRLGCLATSGHVAIETFTGTSRIVDCRIKKTKLFHEQPEFFMAWLVAEMKVCENYAKKKGLPFSARLNGTSDIDWVNTSFHNNNNIFDFFDDTVMFYDYTKLNMRFINKPANYHLTYSYTGRNTFNAISLLQKGHNVAVVFNVKKGKPLPVEFLGRPVIDGDLTDFRVADGSGVIVGLRFKRIADRKVEQEILNSTFVVNPETNIQCIM